jgi:hypothetical protein
MKGIQTLLITLAGSSAATFGYLSYKISNNKKLLKQMAE